MIESVDLLAPKFKLIFLDVSIVFNFEFILASVNFFLSTGAVVVGGIGLVAAIYFYYDCLFFYSFSLILLSVYLKEDYLVIYERKLSSFFYS